MIKKILLKVLFIMTSFLLFFFVISFNNSVKIKAAEYCVNSDAQVMPIYTKKSCEKNGFSWENETNTTKVKIFCYKIHQTVYKFVDNNAVVDYYIYKIEVCKKNNMYELSNKKINVNYEGNNPSSCNQANPCFKLSNDVTNQNVLYLLKIDSGQPKSCYDINGKMKECKEVDNIYVHCGATSLCLTRDEKSCYSKDGTLISCVKLTPPDLEALGVASCGTNCRNSFGVLIDCSDISNQSDSAFYLEKINEYIPAISAILSVLLGLRGAILGIQYMKAAEEPNVRQEKIKSLKNLAIGVAIIFVILLSSTLLLNYFIKNI